ncbi:hypothetical protein MNBD_BACTEROID05-1082 [hydrothermal vent metagenome]|uniref:Uncharacterized protein n=1 Tax=hydrothermal vent metagenome TaxID=652676 RepID=A0A3B0TJP8_9ZZZZ
MSINKLTLSHGVMDSTGQTFNEVQLCRMI